MPDSPNPPVSKDAVAFHRFQFNLAIGSLDRSLSEFLSLYSSELDHSDRQTLKHHADDLIGVGNKMHELLNTES